MKKAPVTAVLCATALLCGCGSGNSSANETTTADVTSSASENAPQSETVSIAAAADTTASSAEVTSLELYHIKVNEGRIDITPRNSGSEPVQVIEGDFHEYNKVWFEDFDFDGCSDMGVTTDEGCLYYHFDSATGRFEEWQTLSDIGGKLYISEIYDNCLSTVEYTTDGSSNTYYKWENGKAVPFKKRTYYELAGDDIIEFYDLEADGQWVKTTRNVGKDGHYRLEEDPPYFRINENSIDVLVAGNVIQTIEGYRLPELAWLLDGKATLELKSLTADDMIDEIDYDFDGHFDAYIIKSWDNGYKGDYYRYDPEKRQYVMWDELNALGGERLYPDPEEKELYHSYELPFAEYTYKWNDGKMKLVSRDVYEYDGKGGSTVYTYEYDENGNATLVDTEKPTS